MATQVLQGRQLEPVKHRDSKIKKGYACAVTVCIAATCQDKGEPRIVVCADTRLSYPNIGSTNTTVKVDVLGHGWLVQMAGDWSAVRILCSLLKDRIQAQTSVTLRNIMKESKEAVREFKRGPAFTQSDTTQLLISGFEGKEPHILSVSIFDGGKEQIELREPFGSIGSGFGVADILLSLRECRPDMPLPYVAYLVYEAKRSSEKLGSVGTFTTLSVHSPNITDLKDRAYVKVLSEVGIVQLEAYYRGLWKVPVATFPDFTEDFFIDLEAIRSHQFPKRGQ